MTEFKERVLRPQMRTLSSVVEADLLSRAYKTVPNLVGTAGSVPTTMKTYAQARAKLEAYLTPPGMRSVIFSSNANTELVDASKALFHAGSQIERGFLRGSLGEAQGADFYEHQSVPSHTNGSQVTALQTAAAGAEGATSIAVDTGTGTNTVKAGSVFTFPGVYAVHPLTGVATTTLQQFTVTADLTLSAGAGTLSFYPALKASAPNKTVSALPADNAVLTWVGAASTSYAQNLMFHRDAFTTAFAPLPVLASCEGYTARLPSGVSVRVMTFGDGNNDYERTRIDVLYGFTAVRPLWAARITE
jgi:P22 coat protein - gene protein 5